MICHLDKIILNEDKEKRIRIENSAPIWWRFGVGQENPNHKNILTKWELSEISLFHDNQVNLVQNIKNFTLTDSSLESAYTPLPTDYI